MSFYSNFQSSQCPGQITGNAANGLCEKVCIQAQKIFDACIKQIQLENYTITITDPTPAQPTYPLTFVSARSATSAGQITSLTVDRLADKPGCARVQATVAVPVEVAYTDANGADGVAQGVVTVSEDVILSVPAPSIMPYRITAEASAVCAEGTLNETDQTFTVNACVTVILKVAVDVQILLPSYGYCAIPPAQNYSQEVCAGFFELLVYPKSNACGKSCK